MIRPAAQFMDPRLPKRFWDKCIPEPNSGCWLWIGGRQKYGYGTFSWKDKTRRTHRFTYEQWYGPVPDGLVLDHRCNVTSCVNPDHVKPTTDRENVLRSSCPPALNAAKSTCHRGHELTKSPHKTTRYCRTCEIERKRNYNRRTTASRAAYRKRRRQYLKSLLASGEPLTGKTPRTHAILDGRAGCGRPVSGLVTSDGVPTCKQCLMHINGERLNRVLSGDEK